MPLHKPLVFSVIVTTNPHQKKEDIVQVYQLHGIGKINTGSPDKYDNVKKIKHVVSFDQVKPQYGLSIHKNVEKS